MKKTLTKATVSALTALIVASCSNAKVEPAEANPTPHDMKEGEGLVSGKSGNILDAFRDKDAKGHVVGGSVLVPVNPYMWRASLEALSFMSLAQTDSTGGTIITDWYTNPKNKNERVKVNVLILGRDFAVQNLKVTVFKQINKENKWVDVKENTAVALQLEETILTNARTLKVKETAQ